MTSDDTTDDEEGATHSTAKRHWLTNDGLAWLLVGSFPIMILVAAAGMVALGRLPEMVLFTYVGAVTTAVVWAFGKDAVEAWRGGQP